MSWQDWLSDVPVIGDVVDVLELLDVTAAVAAVDYESIRDAMYWTTDSATGLDTRNAMLSSASIAPVTFDDQGAVTSGLWTDPVTGYTSSDPSDFDVDHRVPFSHVASVLPGFADMSDEERLAVFNDKDNLEVLHDAHNASKGDTLPDEYALEIDDGETRRRFIESARSYAEKMHIPMAKPA